MNLGYPYPLRALSPPTTLLPASSSCYAQSASVFKNYCWNRPTSPVCVHSFQWPALWIWSSARVNKYANILFAAKSLTTCWDTQQWHVTFSHMCNCYNFQPSLSPQAPSKNSDREGLETRLTSLQVGVGKSLKTPYNFHWPRTLSVWEAPAISHYTHSGCPETSRLLLLQSRHLWPSIEQDLQQFREETLSCECPGNEATLDGGRS